VNVVGFENINIHKFGNELTISGMIFSKGKDLYFLPFPDVDYSHMKMHMITSDTLDWNKLIYQLDNVETVVKAKDENNKLVKIIVRKSQRKLEEKIVWNVFRRDRYTCQYCGRLDVPLTIDHIIRWENMGQTVEDNLISACKKCNNTRGNMEFEDWLKSDYYLEHCKDIHMQRWNKEAFEKAKNLPLREYKRNR
jgi:hypothetical protein